jgi:hypothetical protein
VYQSVRIATLEASSLNPRRSVRTERTAARRGNLIVVVRHVDMLRNQTMTDRQIIRIGNPRTPTAHHAASTPSVSCKVRDHEPGHI